MSEVVVFGGVEVIGGCESWDWCYIFVFECTYRNSDIFKPQKEILRNNYFFEKSKNDFLSLLSCVTRKAGRRPRGQLSGHECAARVARKLTEWPPQPSWSNRKLWQEGVFCFFQRCNFLPGFNFLIGRQQFKLSGINLVTSLLKNIIGLDGAMKIFQN